MSFDKLQAKELREVVRQFVGEEEAQTARNKNELLAALTEEGVTFGMYQSMQNAEKADPEEFLPPKASQPEHISADDLKDKVLVKMDRENGTFQCYGVTFTKAHPYALVDEETANTICMTFEGFRLALPREVQEFYV